MVYWFRIAPTPKELTIKATLCNLNTKYEMLCYGWDTSYLLYISESVVLYP